MGAAVAGAHAREARRVRLHPFGRVARAGILPGAEPEQDQPHFILARAIVREDDALFQSIPGIGKKTAQRVVLELKEKIAPLAAVEAPHLGAGDGHIVARDALVELGYSPAEAEQRLAAVDPDLPPAERVREALRAA